MLLPAALTGNSQKRKRMADEAGVTNMEKVTELLHGRFHFKVLPDSAVDRAKVSTATLNCLITRVLRSYDCTVPIKVRHMLLLNYWILHITMRLIVIN